MCKYCKESVALVDTKDIGLVIYSGNHAYIRGFDKQGWDVSVPFKINYCPDCGEKLSK